MSIFDRKLFKKSVGITLPDMGERRPDSPEVLQRNIRKLQMRKPPPQNSSGIAGIPSNQMMVKHKRIPNQYDPEMEARMQLAQMAKGMAKRKAFPVFRSTGSPEEGEGFLSSMSKYFPSGFPTDIGKPYQRFPQKASMEDTGFFNPVMPEPPSQTTGDPQTTQPYVQPAPINLTQQSQGLQTDTDRVIPDPYADDQGQQGEEIVKQEELTPPPPDPDEDKTTLIDQIKQKVAEYKDILGEKPEDRAQMALLVLANFFGNVAQAAGRTPKTIDAIAQASATLPQGLFALAQQQRKDDKAIKLAAINVVEEREKAIVAAKASMAQYMAKKDYDAAIKSGAMDRDLAGLFNPRNIQSVQDPSTGRQFLSPFNDFRAVAKAKKYNLIQSGTGNLGGDLYDISGTFKSFTIDGGNLLKMDDARILSADDVKFVFGETPSAVFKMNDKQLEAGGLKQTPSYTKVTRDPKEFSEAKKNVINLQKSIRTIRKAKEESGSIFDPSSKFAQQFGNILTAFFSVEAFRDFQTSKKLPVQVVLDSIRQADMGARPLKQIAEYQIETFKTMMPSYFSDRKVAVRNLNDLEVGLQRKLVEEYAKINPHMGKIGRHLSSVPKGTKDDPFMIEHAMLPIVQSTIRGFEADGDSYYISYPDGRGGRKVTPSNIKRD